MRWLLASLRLQQPLYWRLSIGRMYSLDGDSLWPAEFQCEWIIHKTTVIPEASTSITKLCQTLSIQTEYSSRVHFLYGSLSWGSIGRLQHHCQGWHPGMYGVLKHIKPEALVLCCIYGQAGTIARFLSGTSEVQSLEIKLDTFTT